MENGSNTNGPANHDGNASKRVASVQPSASPTLQQRSIDRSSGQAPLDTSLLVERLTSGQQPVSDVIGRFFRAFAVFVRVTAQFVAFAALVLSILWSAFLGPPTIRAILFQEVVPIGMIQAWTLPAITLLLFCVAIQGASKK